MTDTVRHYSFGPFLLETNSRSLRAGSEEIELQPTVFKTLLALLQNAGRVMSKEELLSAIWEDRIVEEANLTQNIFVLRKHLQQHSQEKYIITIPGYGYRFSSNVEIDERSHVSSATATTLQCKSVAILPFRVVPGQSDLSHVGAAISGAIIERLRETTDLRLVTAPRESILDASNTTYQSLGYQLKVKSVLYGLVQHSEDQIRITAQLVATNDGEVLWAKKYDYHNQPTLEVQDKVAQKIAEAVGNAYGTNEARLGRRDTEIPEAFEAYVRGSYFWNKRTLNGLRAALSYALQAIELDPAYSRAYVGVADTYAVLPSIGGPPPNESFPKAKAAALKALELNPTSAPAHISLAFLTYRYEWNWLAAEPYFKKGIALQPTYATGHHWYGEYLFMLGRFDDSKAAFAKAHALDPLSLAISADYGGCLRFAGELKEAEHHLRSALEMDQSFNRVLHYLGLVLVEQGNTQEALELLSRASDLNTDASTSLGALGYALGFSGNRKEAEKILQELQHPTTIRTVYPYDLAVVAAGLHKHDLALDYLEKALNERDIWLAMMGVDPCFAELRSFDRYASIFASLGGASPEHTAGLSTNRSSSQPYLSA